MTTRLPRSDEAILDIRKIEDYCLSPSHPRGRHKARVFREPLTLSAATPRGCEMSCLMLHAPARSPRLPWMLGGPIGASMRPSGDTERVLW
jgi:hypothetical protein